LKASQTVCLAARERARYIHSVDGPMTSQAVMFPMSFHGTKCSPRHSGGRPQEMGIFWGYRVRAWETDAALLAFRRSVS
jgi:hypothetical protein